MRCAQVRGLSNAEDVTSGAGTTKAEHFARAYLALACQALKWQYQFEGARSQCINARGDMVVFSRVERVKS